MKHQRKINEEYVPRQKRQSISRIQKEPPYVHFYCDGPQVITIANLDFKDSDFVEGFEYSTDKEEWNELTLQSFPLWFDDNLWLRGKSRVGTNGMIFNFQNNKVLTDIEGDINTLIDWENYLDCYTGDASFRDLFFYCESLRNASKFKLSMTYTQTEFCYADMFHGCKDLISAPEISLMTLTDSCCQGMFENCSKLENCPSILPATTLADSCYFAMFRDCTKLNKFPKLPATELTYECYREMFLGCVNLEFAPDLPAKELAEHCYSYMFYECYRLKQKASIPFGVQITNFNGKDTMYGKCSKLIIDEIKLKNNLENL